MTESNSVHSRSLSSPEIKKERLFILIGLTVLTLPFLAHSVQSADSGEFIQASLQKGILHPPGFPLQAWLNRWIVLFPFGNPVQRISLLSALGHIGMGYYFWRTLFFLGLEKSARVTGTFGLCLFPSLWHLGVQPEVFSLSHFFMTAILSQSIFLATSEDAYNSNRQARYLGFWVGLGGSQHPIVILSFPLFLYSAFLLLKNKGQRVQRFLNMSLAFIIPFCGLYLSLLFLNTPESWPNWGNIRTVPDVIHHALRSDYGTFRFASANEDTVNAVSALSTFFHALTVWRAPFLFLFGFGVWELITKSISSDRKVLFRTILMTFCVGLIFLSLCEAWGQKEIYTSVQMRFLGVAVIPLSLAFSLGVEKFSLFLEEYLFPDLIGERCQWALIAAFLFSYVALGFHYANASALNTADLFLQGISEELSLEAYYVSKADLEAPYGVPAPSKSPGSRRYPLDVGHLEKKWYQEFSIPIIEPRLPKNLQNSGGGYEKALFEYFEKQNATLISADPTIFWNHNRKAELTGLVFTSTNTSQEILTPKTVQAAIRLCPLTEKLPKIDPELGFHKNLSFHFARAYMGASRYLRSIGDFGNAKLFNEINESIKAGAEPQLWIEGCEKLKKAFSQ